MQYLFNKQHLVKWWSDEAQRPFLVLALAVFVMILLAFIAKGTGDDGDSVVHYLYARYAFVHPYNFFNHWAKPLYVMAAAPFAQFGITGVKLLNIGFWAIQLYCTIKIAQHFDIRWQWLLPIFAILAPMNVTHTLSGLTEPMFAAVFSMGILFLLRRQYVLGYLIFSFLPFVRSEGLIILCPLLLYALWRLQYLHILLFPVGHLVMSVLGKPIHGDYWWVFNKMTYRGLESAYGSGKWDHFINNLPSVIGIALCLMLIIGLLSGFFRLMAGGRWFRDPLARDEAWLVYGMFLSYFIAHSIFWSNGMFNSFGLMRVMLGIMPAMLLICLQGWGAVAQGFKMVNARIVPVGLALFLAGLAWSFFGRLSWEVDFSPNAAQKSLGKAADAILDKFPNRSENVYYLEAYAAALPLELDIFDRYHTREIWRLNSGEPVPPNSIVVYDQWFFPSQNALTLEDLRKDKRLAPMGEYEGSTRNEKSNKTYLFYVLPGSTPSDWKFEINWDSLSERPKVVDIGGRRAVKIDKNQEYSEAFRSGLKSYPEGASLLITFDGYCEKPGEDFPGLLTFSAEAEYQPYDWRGRPLKVPGLPANTWHQFRFVEKLPKGKDNMDKIGACLWNASPDPIYINHFKVELLPN